MPVGPLFRFEFSSSRVVSRVNCRRRAFRVNDLNDILGRQFCYNHHTFSTATQDTENMAPVKKEKEEMSAFERSRLANIATNQAIVKDLSSAAAKIAPKPMGRPKSAAPRKKAASVKREEPRPTRTSSRLAGIEADSETQKRKAEVEYEFALEQAKAKKQRVSGDLNFNDIVVDGKKWSKDDGFLSGIMRGAQPNVRTFTEEDVKETTDEGLKALREKMSALDLYEGYEPNRMLPYTSQSQLSY